MTREGEPTRITLDEATLLAWVEGDLPPEMHRRVSIALSREPRLRELAEGMVADRDDFRSMGDDTAPAGLLADVADALEREMLVGLQEEGIAVSSRPPKSVVAGKIGPSGGARKSSVPLANGLWQDRFGRRLAMAAGLLLVVGGAGTLGVLLWPDRSTTLAPTHSVFDGQIAMDERGGTGETVEAEPRPTQSLPLGAESDPVRIAEAPEPKPITETLESSREAERPLVRIAESPPTPSGRPVDTTRAAQLAAEGRLLVRVRSVDLGEMLAGFDRLGTQRRVDVVPRDVIAGDIERLTVALQEERRRMGVVAHATDLQRERSSDTRPRRSQPSEADPRVLAEQVRVIEVAPDGRELALLRSRLLGERALLVEFFATDEPMPVGTPPNIEDLLWWTLPPDRWTPRVRVPVLIEGSD
ncbi:MAG: hypothetical protein JJU33_02375 [Phycisphaerales bacterium]|nr:hypothetical protein [Phycisphaerales bacterium]